MFKWRKSTASGYTKDLPHGKARATGGEVFCRGPFDNKVTVEQYIEDMKEVLEGADQKLQERLAQMQKQYEESVKYVQEHHAKAQVAIKAVIEGGVEGILADLPEQKQTYGFKSRTAKPTRTPIYPAGNFGAADVEEDCEDC